MQCMKEILLICRWKRLYLRTVFLTITTRQCRVYKYDLEEDYIYLELKEDDLTAISLDAKYRCYISTRTELLYCTGVVKERYRCEDTNLLKFRIENGFYNVYEGRKMIKRA